MDEMSMEEVVENIILNKCLDSNNNNYAFSNLTDIQMNKIKTILLNNKTSKVIYCVDYLLDGEVKKSLNIIYDCFETPIDDLLDWKKVRLGLQDKTNHITINIINLQEIGDRKKLQQLNETILKCGDNICFNLFTTDMHIKETFTQYGKSLNDRDDLSKFLVYRK